MTIFFKYKQPFARVIIGSLIYSQNTLRISHIRANWSFVDFTSAPLILKINLDKFLIAILTIHFVKVLYSSIRKLGSSVNLADFILSPSINLVQ